MDRTLRFDNRFARELPGDPRSTNERRQVLGACWSRVAPTPVAAPRLLAHSAEVASMLGFGPDDHQAQAFAEVFGGNAMLDGMDPIAACYGGHQFGQWAGQLGDGRAISLGEVLTEAGARWELQLKGAGPTPYARTADGRAVLRSSIREFLCSEAMHYLGIPTTRALSLVGTGETVLRDMFYDGRPELEPGAVVCRVSPSFLRFGNYEILTARGDHALLRQLVDFTIDRDFPQLGPAAEDRDAHWFAEVCERTAQLLVHWMRVGFVHGVMNTDNMSVLGLTIDYGPYGWLEEFDPHWTPNTTDAAGRRYRYANQPAIAQWNLERLADAVRPLFTDVAPLREGLQRYVQAFNEGYTAMLARKFGFPDFHGAHETLATEAFTLLQDAGLDFTNFFRALTDLDGPIPDDDAAALDLLGDVFYDDTKRAGQTAALADWLRRWDRLATARAPMARENPVYVLRNYLAQEAIDQATAGDVGGVHTLLDVMRRPYERQPGRERYAARRPEWARVRAGCSMLSCSS